MSRGTKAIANCFANCVDLFSLPAVLRFQTQGSGTGPIKAAEWTLFLSNISNGHSQSAKAVLYTAQPFKIKEKVGI